MARMLTALPTHKFSNKTNIKLFLNEYNTRIPVASLNICGKTKIEKLAHHTDSLLLYKEAKRILKKYNSTTSKYCYGRLQKIIKDNICIETYPDFYITDDTAMIVGIFISVDTPYAILTRYDEKVDSWITHYGRVNKEIGQSGTEYNATFYDEVGSLEDVKKHKQGYDNATDAVLFINMQSDKPDYDALLTLKLAVEIQLYQMTNHCAPTVEWIDNKTRELSNFSDINQEEKEDDLDQLLSVY